MQENSQICEFFREISPHSMQHGQASAELASQPPCQLVRRDALKRASFAFNHQHDDVHENFLNSCMKSRNNLSCPNPKFYNPPIPKLSSEENRHGKHFYPLGQLEHIYRGSAPCGTARGSPHARYRVRIQFENLLRLAHADRPVERAQAAGTVPPEMRQLWNRMKSKGVKVELFHRGGQGIGEQEMPDHFLQKCMLENALDYNGTPGIAVLLTGDGAGYQEGAGFHSTLERMHKKDWRIEVLSWEHSCNQAMRRWAEENGKFVALDDFYEAITFLEPSSPGYELAPPRDAAKLDLSRRAIS